MSNFSTSSHSAAVIDFAADGGLTPEVRIMELDGEPEQMLNADGVIALLRDGDTPAARSLYRNYRKIKMKLKRQFPELEDKELRQRAILEAMPVRMT